MNPEPNQIDVGGSCMPRLPSELQQCRRTGKKNWHCSLIASPGKIYCEKHRLERDIYNEKRRNERNNHKENGFSMDPLLPSGQRQCRRLEKGWLCPDMASPGKLYCEKHQLEQNLHARKLHELRRKEKCLVTSGCNEMKCFFSDNPTCMKGTRQAEGKTEKKSSTKDVQVQCPEKGSGVTYVNSFKVSVESGVIDVRHRNPKRYRELLSSSLVGQQISAIHLEKHALPTNEGINFEAADDNKTIGQIDPSPLLNPTLEDHQARSSRNERSNHSVVEYDKGFHWLTQLVRVDRSLQE